MNLDENYFQKYLANPCKKTKMKFEAYNPKTLKSY